MTVQVKQREGIIYARIGIKKNSLLCHVSMVTLFPTLPPIILASLLREARPTESWLRVSPPKGIVNMSPGDALGAFLVGAPVSSPPGGDREADIAVLKGRCGPPKR